MVVADWLRSSIYYVLMLDDASGIQRDDFLSLQIRPSKNINAVILNCYIEHRTLK